MTEFIMQMVPGGNEDVEICCVCVGFAGLDRESYDVLELSIDGEQFIQTERDPTRPFKSLPICFPALKPDQVYTITGHIVCQGTAIILSTRMSSILYHSQHNASSKGMIFGGGGVAGV